MPENFEIRMPSGTDDPLSDAEIQRYREEINRLDREILDAVKRRSDISKAIGKTRMGSGGTRLAGGSTSAIVACSSLRPAASDARERPIICDGPTPLPV